MRFGTVFHMIDHTQDLLDPDGLYEYDPLKEYDNVVLRHGGRLGGVYYGNGVVLYPNPSNERARFVYAARRYVGEATPGIFLWLALYRGKARFALSREGAIRRVLAMAGIAA